MKKKIWKPVVTGVSVLLAGVIVSTTVMNSKLEAEAADTFLGIQNLITEVSQEYQATQEKYTILEVVPDRSASEIGYFFPGYEPALSKWDDTQMRWVSWKEQLAECTDAAAREALVESLKVKLQAYYDANGITGGPVSYATETYQESDTPLDGYELIEFEGTEKTGWFVLQSPLGMGYDLVFLTDAYVTDSGIVYYQAIESSATLITNDNKDSIDPSAAIYKKQTAGDGTEYYMYYGTWENVSQEEVVTFSNRNEDADTENEEDVDADADGEGDDADAGAEGGTGEGGTDNGDGTGEGGTDNGDGTGEGGTDNGDGTGDGGTDNGDGTGNGGTDNGDGTGDAGTDNGDGDEGDYTVSRVSVQLPILLSGLNNDDSTDGEGDVSSGDLNTDTGNNNDNNNNSSSTVSSGNNADPADENDPNAGEGSDDDEDEQTDISANGYYTVTFERIADTSALNDGDRVYIVDEQNIVKSDNAQYAFEEKTVEEGGQLYRLSQDNIYIKNAFSNEEWFRKYVLSMTEAEYGNFPVEVISYTPEELETARVNGTFPDFDFLFINSGKSDGWKYGAAADANAKIGGDITGDVWNLLYAKVKNNLLPCLIDGNVIFVQEDADSTWATKNTALENTNMFLLCTAFCQESLGSTDYAAASGSKEALWNGLAEGKEDGHFTTDHVYCHTGDSSIVNDQFSAFLIYQEGGYVPAGFQKVLDEIELENLYRQSDASGGYTMLPTDISQALVVRHIMNYQNRRNAEAKANIRVLEIQPAKTADGKPELTLAQIQKWAPQVQTADITVMTTAEFIGKVETLNDKYDLIYIGTNKAHMNTRKGTDSAIAQGSTVFNDSAMDGLIYFHTGDMRYSGMELSGQLDTDYWNRDRAQNVFYYIPVRYGGNDITKEKMNALFSYLDGSYPVVVSDEFFESPVTFFEDSDYKGYSVDFKEGVYNMGEMEAQGLRNDAVSSLKVRDGYRVIAYQDINFGGTSITWNAGNINYVGNAYNDWITSFKVESVAGAQSQKKINGDHIDNSSYMYEFAKTALDKKYTNFYSFSDIEEDSELFQFYLNRPKVKLMNISVNGTRRDDIYYIQDVNGRYNLEYHFTILNEGAATANTQYQCKLYIDVNADGKFSSQEVLDDITITSGGSVVAANQLYAGNEYVLRRVVPDGYKGVLPWKVEVSQVNNDNIYCFMGGYTKLEGLDPETIKIIQICRDHVLYPGPDWWGFETERFMSLAEQINGKKTIYEIGPGVKVANGGTYVLESCAYSSDTEYVDGYENNLYYILVHGGTYDGVYYEGIDDEFDIDVDFFTISKFEEELANGNIDMDEYNMLIMGFSDAYGEFSGSPTNPAEPLGAIVNFINSGKSVLMAHDNTSYFNFEKGKLGITNRKDATQTMVTGQYHHAYTLNRNIRDLVGMDRYGILELAVLQRGNALQSGTGDWNTVINSGKDVAYKAKSGRTQTVPEVQGYTYSIINAKDKADTSLYTTAETGLSSDWHNRYLNIKYGTVHYNDGIPGQPWVGPSDEGEIPGNYDGAVHGLWVTQVNKGQITEYPYKLAQTFPVSTTHGQYYQLDFTADDDKDGQSDLVVWYCLGNRKSNSGAFQDTIYSMSPNDVANNYYIYNKGNITYTGMGHSGRDSAYMIDEAKLFINTMIAAYSAGMKPPIITIQEDASYGSPQMKVMYRYYDEDLALDTVGSESDPYEKVYFTVRDVNFVKGTRRMVVKAFYTTSNGNQTIVVNNENIRVNELERSGTVFDASTNQVVNPDNLQSGGIYYIQIPKSVLANCDSGMKIYIETQSVISSETTVHITDKIYASLDVMKVYLFDLN